jgi:deoxyribodipyrimidine photolyase-related protein
MTTCRNLILLPGDQLSPNLSALKAADPSRDRVLIVEVEDEATYVRHHKKKIAFLFSAMRHFADGLRERGWDVDYVAIDDQDNAGSFTGELERAIGRLGPERIVVTEPGEWRVRQAMEGWSKRFDLPVDILADDRFVCTADEFAEWAEGRKQLRMEYFYREMRRKTGLLMDGDQPEGGRWNFDAENRKAAKDGVNPPGPKRFEPDETTAQVLKLVGERFGDHLGDLEPFWFAVTADQAEEALDHFIDKALPSFGDYQDAMLSGEPFMFHSILSLYFNVGLLDPLTVCRRVEAEYKAGRVPLNSAEGFIRQIIGWREYVRGIYWLKMPGYVAENALGAKRPLPDFYWTGETDMACVTAAVTQTLQEAYAHHIQRLMITGNFAMLAGVDPGEVHEWYLMVYADAYEWVELPNTLGMSQFADGGLLASKPYAASGNYINKMSDYCGNCRYDVKTKTGEGACPFNPLYWDFLARNEKKLRDNPRLTQVYRTWDRMDEKKKADYRKSAKAILDAL